jgi:predicted RNA-binding protein with PIN domain
VRTFVIDGYNLIFAFPQIPAGTWAEKRSQLEDFLRLRRPHGNNYIILVYDSREGGGSMQQVGELKIVYTAGETADDWIAQKVRKAQNPRTLVVVSNDQGIRRQVQGTGARFVTADDFLRSAKTARSLPIAEEVADQDRITDELKKKWL